MTKTIILYSKEDLSSRPKLDERGRKQDYSGLELVKPINDNLSFLRKLHLRLNKEQEVESYGHGKLPECMRTVVHYWETIHRARLQTTDLEKVLRLIRHRDDLTMFPANINSGLAIGFFTFYMSARLDHKPKRALKFTEDQLPKDYSFRTLSRTFASEANRQRILAHHLMPSEDYEMILDRVHFDY